ncbi:MAG: hypothetical protein IPL53_22085 [Ignavibacteria bacterium]|nr:hypothetical protein [Ignavibacteria bacterium]
MGPFPKGAIAFIPVPHGVGATIPDTINIPIVVDRVFNRRVEIKIRPFGGIVPLPDTFDVPRKDSLHYYQGNGLSQILKTSGLKGLDVLLQKCCFLMFRTYL